MAPKRLRFSNENKDEETNLSIGPQKKAKKNVTHKEQKESPFMVMHKRLHSNENDILDDQGRVFCRESESQSIFDYITESVTDNNWTLRHNYILYVYGPPGTGKTLTIRSVIDGNHFCALPGKPSRVAYINCMSYNSFRSMEAIYFHVHSVVRDNESTFTNANTLRSTRKRRASLLGSSEKEERMETPEAYLRRISLHSPIVLVVDEIDSLKPKEKAKVLSFLNDAISKSIHFVIIAVSNNFNYFSKREIGQYNIKKLSFKPYTANQLECILLKKLEGLESVFNPFAVKLCAKKVSSTTGDIRRALSILRSALDVNVDTTGQLLLDMKNVCVALEQVYGSRLKAAIIQDTITTKVLEKKTPNDNVEKKKHFLPFQQGLIICCILKLMKNNASRKGIAQSVNTETVYNLYLDTCQRLKVERLSFEEIMQVLPLMEAQALISLKSSKKNLKNPLVLGAAARVTVVNGANNPS